MDETEAASAEPVWFLVTERLGLRRFTEHDGDLLEQLDSDPRVMLFINGGQPTPREEISLGYRLKHSAWGQGYAIEGSRALIELGFETMGVGTVVAVADPGNEASIGVMRKLGMRHEGPTRLTTGVEVVKCSLRSIDWRSPNGPL